MCPRTTRLQLPRGARSRGWIRVERMCGHIQRGAFADLWLGGRCENEIDFKVLRSMERLRNEMKWAAGFLSCHRGMVVG